jgi:hypothetical protein
VDDISEASSKFEKQRDEHGQEDLWVIFGFVWERRGVYLEMDFPSSVRICRMTANGADKVRLLGS